jgi:PKD domain-containing protein/List-Bact-rpt repeat protein
MARGAAHRAVRRRRPWIRSVVTGTAVVGAVAAMGIVGAHGGYPATRPHLMSGAAWLASSRVGQLTLLDGSSVEVAGQVQVATPGDGLDAVQQGSTAYAVNRTTGTLRRVDGATFAVSRAVSPIPGATGSLTAFAGPNALYALDSGRGVLAEADPRTLAGHGGPVSMAARLGDQSASIDDRGRLWVLDSETGNLERVKNGQRYTVPRVAAPGGSLLALAGGAPVVVDPGSRTAVLLDPDTGAEVHRTTLDLRADDRIAVSGSPHSARLYVVASRGVLAVCELTASTCSAAVALGDGGGQLGAAVETGGRLFVPDYTGGRVWVVDLGDLRVVATPEVVPAGTRFQLLTRDTVVFFNDPDSERAGVIRLDGGVRKVAKYDPGNPETGPHTNGGNGPAPKPSAVRPSDGPPKRPEPKPTPPSPSGSPTPTPTPTATPTPTPTPTGTTPPPVPDLRISASASPSQVGQAVRMSVRAATDPQPVDARWDFGDGSTGTGLSADHTWTAARTYLVTVVATFPDSRTNTGSVSQVVQNPPPPKGTLRVSSTGPGRIVSSPRGISCPTTCSAQFTDGTAVTLTAIPNDANSQFEEYGGDCTGATPPTCQLTITTAGASVTGTFTEINTNRTLTLNISGAATAGGGGIVEVVTTFPADGGECVDPQCVYTVDETETATLTASRQGEPGFLFDHWSGACQGRNRTCVLKMTVNRTVTAVFVTAPGAAPAGAVLAPSGPAARRRRRFSGSRRR